MTEIIIIRHGETHWNTEHRLQGWRDTDLNSVGHLQAQALAKRLAHDHHHGNRPIDQVIQVISNALITQHKLWHKLWG
jgi:broad specificity phosphatase PhoE